jgi:hypothetical protein
MPAIDRLLKRWGFVKLSRYGLVLTPEERIMSLRSTILDDGLGGRVVGWQDGDLAAAELRAWESASSAPPRPVAPVMMRPAPAPVAAAPAPAHAPAPRAAVTVAPMAAPQAPVEEDEWEWAVVMARARAAAEEAEEAARIATAKAPTPSRPTTLVTPASTRPTPSPIVPRATDAMSPLRPAPASTRTRPFPAPPLSEGTPPSRPALSPADASSRLRPVVKPRVIEAAPPAPAAPQPAAIAVSVRETSNWSATELTDDGDYTEAVELLTARAPDRSPAPPARSVVHTIPRKEPASDDAPPRRLAKGTSPQAIGATPARPRASADEPTATDLVLPEHSARAASRAADFQLEERTISNPPSLPVEERTRRVAPLPSIRDRLSR